jgi:hypothetical protein
MFKLIPIILSLSLMGAGGATMSVKNYYDNAAKTNLQNYMCAGKNVGLNMQDSSDLFLKSNTNPSL